MMCGARSGRARRWAVSCAGALFAVLSALSFQGTAAVAAEKAASNAAEEAAITAKVALEAAVKAAKMAAGKWAVRS